jgi:hypothetical protein
VTRRNPWDGLPPRGGPSSSVIGHAATLNGGNVPRVGGVGVGEMTG